MFTVKLQHKEGKMTFSWKCPVCNQNATIGDNEYSDYYFQFGENSKSGWQTLKITSIICPNRNCKEYSLSATLYNDLVSDSINIGAIPEHFWRLIPRSPAKVLPDYIPQAIRDDYEEACLISDLSPKASATLARRCIQGMIRNFWNIRKRRLIDEIAALEEKVDSLTWQAIDAVRSMGNIGAHMEEDINVIIDVEPDEASKLIYLIETLIEDWYITRHEKEERLKGVAELKEKKTNKKSDGGEEKEDNR